jgi:hypothetical protein
MANPIKPVGVGDLLVVKQHIVGYEPSEVAFVENILKGETHTREVRRAETTELSVTTETEHVSEEERDLQSTERFEVKRESEQVASADGQLKSPAYGGLVDGGGGSLQSTEKQASTYAKDVTSRAVSKITERLRTQIVQRTVREFEEKTSHTFAAGIAAGNVTGIYQWLDKVYENQVYNYGKRLLYDLVVPEPGAFLLQAFARAQSEGRELVNPGPWTLSPSMINEGTYTSLVNKYQATGVEPPPALYLTASKSFKGTPTKETGDPDANEIPIPPNYEAYKCWIRLNSSPYTDVPPPAPGTGESAKPCIQIVVGDHGPFVSTFYIPKSGGPFPPPLPPDPPLNFAFNLDGATDKVPIAITTWHIVSYAFNIIVTLKRTTASLDRWRHRTYDQLFAAYQRQKAEYEERLANLLAALRVGVIGYNSHEKRTLERDELKKNCLELITSQFFDAFGLSMQNVTQFDPVTGEAVPYAQPRLPFATLLGPYVRFFEQAFEWEQMMYALYAYFWARKEYWMRRVTIEDTDEAFAAFLKAGSARVVIPVRPGFEQAVIHYMEKGVIWDGGPPPDINSPLYVPIIAELKAAQQAAGTETPYGDSWRNRLPTALVQLRADDKLPAWKKAAGSDEWVPA